MTYAIELSIRGPADAVPRVGAWVDERLSRACAGLDGLLWADAYAPAGGGGADPFVDDGPGPAGIVMLAFGSLGAASAALAAESFREAWRERPEGLACTSTAFERIEFAVAGRSEAQSLAAPFSYVVRYHRPADDEAAFVRHYVATHAPMLGQLPAVRNVMCYLPQAWSDPNGLQPADYMLGNEVTFDGHHAFQAAMASPIRRELRSHWREFPAFAGANTHYPMARRRLGQGR